MNFLQNNPIARRNRGYDRERSKLIPESIRVYTLATGKAVTREGCAMVSLAENGSEVVQPSDGSTDVRFLGVALTDESAFPIKAEVEQVTVPAGGAGPFLATLKYAPDASSLILLDSSGTALTPGGGSDYTISGAVITFTAGYQAANPGAVIDARYARTLSVADLEVLGGQSHLNSRGGAKWGVTEVGKEGDFFTMCYDTAEEYVYGNQLYTGADGMFTTDNTSGIKAGMVMQAPNAGTGDPFLGVSLDPAFL